MSLAKPSTCKTVASVKTAAIGQLYAIHGFSNDLSNHQFQKGGATNPQLNNVCITEIGMKAVCLIMIAILLSSCQSLPEHPHIIDSVELSQRLNDIYTSQQTDGAPAHQLNQAISEQNQQHPNLSGYHTIVTGADAFAGRSILTDMARKSIDVQYYIWHNDQAGQLLLQDLWMAAEQGVIVRLLLDDFNTDAKLDAHLLRFASHPNIAVRLINPLTHRKIQFLNFITDLKRINHRMHNKSMTFDRQISIIGGRNIGNEYLSNGDASQFADLDVLLIGAVVDDINDSFDRYWDSPLSYDIETLVTAFTSTDIDAKNSDFLGHLDLLGSDIMEDVDDVSLIYKQAVRESTIGTDLIQKKLPFQWTKALFVSDHVEKLTGNVAPNSLVVNQLRQLLGKPNEKLTIISSYFVPTEAGVATLTQLAQQGVDVKILTNSFHATDVTAVHSGYAQWRAPLLEAGVQLYELKALASEDKRDNRLWRARSQSATSLHAKTFALDDQNVFIGSYNVDPRSANINTEMGVVIVDKDLATKLHAAVSDELLDLAYKVVLAGDGSLQWQTLEDNEIVIYNAEPHVDFSDLIWLKIMSVLPIDWLL